MFQLLYSSRVALLAGGDVLALLLFSAIGRYNHGLPIFQMDTLRTADPFIAGTLYIYYKKKKRKRKRISLFLIRVEMLIDRMVFECILPWWIR